MNSELKDLIIKDLSRIYKNGRMSFKQRLFMPLEIRYLILWRKASFYKHNKPSSPVGKWYNYRLFRLSQKTQIQIPAAVTAGKGLFIGHLGRIIMHPDTVLGDNVNIATGITIGQANRGKYKGTPVIGNRVWIGTNAVIVGAVTIGDDVLIGPGAYVNTDIPAHSIVIGNPAVIHSCENATRDYINNMV